MSIQKKTGVIQGLWAWMLERYPPGIIILHGLVYLTTIAVSQYLYDPKIEAVTMYYLRDGLGIYVFFLFPMLLRIIDEHKDYERDCITHPERVLQRGDTSLSILAKLGWICVLIQAVFSLYVDQGFGSVTIFWLITIGYSLLMAKEFFCGEWLEKRLMLYAISHQLVTPISMLWLCSVSISPAFPSAQIWGLAAAAFCCTFGYEVGRKIRAPIDEKEGVDSYTKALGLRVAPVLTIMFFSGAAGIPIWWFQEIGLTGGLSSTLLLIDGLIFFLCVAVCVLFLHNPQKKWAKSIEGGSAIMTLWVYGWILYAVSTAKEITWMW